MLIIVSEVKNVRFEESDLPSAAELVSGKAKTSIRASNWSVFTNAADVCSESSHP